MAVRQVDSSGIYINFWEVVEIKRRGRINFADQRTK